MLGVIGVPTAAIQRDTCTHMVSTWGEVSTSVLLRFLKKMIKTLNTIKLSDRDVNQETKAHEWKKGAS